MRPRLFIDTNIFIEYFQRRTHHESVRILFNLLEDEKCEGYISEGSLYTITYILEQGLKHKGMQNPQRQKLTRSTLETVLKLVHVAETGGVALMRGVQDTSFRDIEDSYQHQAALASHCDFIITLNGKDYTASSIRVLSPEEFLSGQK